MYISLEYKGLIGASGFLAYLCTCCNLTSLNLTVFSWPGLLTDPRGSSALHLRDHVVCANGWVPYRRQGQSHLDLRALVKDLQSLLLIAAGVSPLGQHRYMFLMALHGAWTASGACSHDEASFKCE